MYVHLKERKYYEGLYDKITVELCRDKEAILRKVFKESKEKGFPEIDDKSIDPESEALRIFNMMHYFSVELLAGERWEGRTETIQEWIDKDTAKDQRVSEARLTTEPVCRHCGKQGLRIMEKELSHRNDDYEHNEVLFMLDCPSCNRRSAIWEDGSPWERMTTNCPKCSATMNETTKRAKTTITTTYTCPKCNHTYSDKLDLKTKKKEEQPDPYWEEDKARFILNDEEGKKYLEAKQNLERMSRLAKEAEEREANKDLYDAVAQIQKVNIGQLSDTLKPLIEKAGYTELTFERPEIGRDVFVGFSCLDGKSDRVEYDSRKQLKKTVEKALSETNWRLMSDGISYRLGYLSGRVRAYEREEDLVGLVKRSGPKKPTNNTADLSANEYRMKGKDGGDIIF